MEIERNSNIELLRIIATLSIVVLHINGYIGEVLDKVRYPGIDSVLIVLIESAASVAVNIFLLIFGYYQSAKTRVEGKRLLLFVDVIFYNLLFYLINILIKNTTFSPIYFLSRFLPINYYIILYIGVYIFSPYINSVLERLDNKKIIELGFICLFVISVEPYFVDILETVMHSKASGLSFIGIDGDSHGYTLSNFILIYIIGAIIRKTEIITKWREINWKFVYSLGTLIICGLEYIYLLSNGTENIVLNYNNPLLIVNSVSLFMIFKNMKETNNKIVNHFAKASLTVYLTHTYILSFIISKLGYVKWYMPIVVVLPFFVYAVSFALYLIFHKCIDCIKSIFTIMERKFFIFKDKFICSILN